MRKRKGGKERKLLKSSKNTILSPIYRIINSLIMHYGFLLVRQLRELASALGITDANAATEGAECVGYLCPNSSFPQTICSAPAAWAPERVRCMDVIGGMIVREGGEYGSAMERMRGEGPIGTIHGHRRAEIRLVGEGARGRW